MHHRIEIEPIGHSTWRVYYRGETLIELARQPALESCRRLLALGLTGKLKMYSRGSDMLRLMADIQRGAGLTVRENRHGRLALRAYRPFEDEDADAGCGSLARTPSAFVRVHCPLPVEVAAGGRTVPPNNPLAPPDAQRANRGRRLGRAGRIAWSLIACGQPEPSQGHGF
jgi:hypothetical protein